MADPETHAFLAELGRMPELLDAAVQTAVEACRRRPPQGGFFLVEHVWHLADLQREGYAERIARLRAGGRPFVPDFDGARLARERSCCGRSPA